MLIRCTHCNRRNPIFRDTCLACGGMLFLAPEPAPPKRPRRPLPPEVVMGAPIFVQVRAVCAAWDARQGEEAS